jgi:hypothetical protein
VVHDNRSSGKQQRVGRITHNAPTGWKYTVAKSRPTGTYDTSTPGCTNGRNDEIADAIST